VPGDLRARLTSPRTIAHLHGAHDEGQALIVDSTRDLPRMADHIPDPGRHRTLFYAYYANRVRGDRAAEEPGAGELEEQPTKEAPL